MRTTPAQRRAARNYDRRRKERKAPRSDAIQRAIVQALREMWQSHITDPGAISLLQDVLVDARRRLVRRGFDAEVSKVRLAKILRSVKVVHRNGAVTDSVAIAEAMGIAVSERMK